MSRAAFGAQAMTRAGLILAPLLLLLAAGRCGKEKDDSGEPQPAGAGVPADWDGLADYPGSAMEVTDE